MIKLSILIPTIEGREECLKNIFQKLSMQISKCNLAEKVEILIEKDNRERTIGAKRNILMARAKGDYICFVDDDDDVSDDYISLILNAIKGGSDCVGIVGIITFDGKGSKKFIHSLVYSKYDLKENIYQRPPNHLNPIKKSIASKFQFPEKSFGEDTDWAMEICKSGILKTEQFIQKPIYFYKYVTTK